MNNRPTVLMTYRGAKTGKYPQDTGDARRARGPLRGRRVQGRRANQSAVVLASLLTEPVIELQDGTVTGVYRALEVSGDEKVLWWRRAVDAFPDYAGYQRKTDRQIPVFVLEPEGAQQ